MACAVKRGETLALKHRQDDDRGAILDAKTLGHDLASEVVDFAYCLMDWN